MAEEEYIKVEFLTDSEKETVVRVLSRNEQVRQQEHARINRLRRELSRMQASHHSDKSPSASNACQRCGTPFGSVFNRGEECCVCELRVCKSCARTFYDGKMFVCGYCHQAIANNIHRKRASVGIYEAKSGDWLRTDKAAKRLLGQQVAEADNDVIQAIFQRLSGLLASSREALSAGSLSPSVHVNGASGGLVTSVQSVSSTRFRDTPSDESAPGSPVDDRLLNQRGAAFESEFTLSSSLPNLPSKRGSRHSRCTESGYVSLPRTDPYADYRSPVTEYPEDSIADYQDYTVGDSAVVMAAFVGETGSICSDVTHQAPPSVGGTPTLHPSSPVSFSSDDDHKYLPLPKHPPHTQRIYGHVMRPVNEQNWNFESQRFDESQAIVHRDYERSSLTDSNINYQAVKYEGPEHRTHSQSPEPMPQHHRHYSAARPEKDHLRENAHYSDHDRHYSADAALHRDRDRRLIDAEDVGISSNTLPAVCQAESSTKILTLDESPDRQLSNNTNAQNFTPLLTIEVPREECTEEAIGGEMSETVQEEGYLDTPVPDMTGSSGDSLVSGLNSASECCAPAQTAAGVVQFGLKYDYKAAALVVDVRQASALPSSDS